MKKYRVIDPDANFSGESFETIEEAWKAIREYYIEDDGIYSEIEDVEIVEIVACVVAKTGGSGPTEASYDSDERYIYDPELKILKDDESNQ